MKKSSKRLLALAATLALSAYGSASTAGGYCYSTVWKLDQYTTAPDLIRSNVPTCGGDFVSGFQVIGNGGISWYADAHHADRCFDRDVTFLPADISAYDMDAVIEYLGLPSIDVFRRVEVMSCL